MPNMDTTSTYDNIESSDEAPHPEKSSPYASTKASTVHKELESDSEQQDEPNVYSTLSISNTIRNGCVHPEPRTYPMIIVCLCAVAGLVIPLLAPFVLYFLIRSRYNWRSGNYIKAYERANQAANLTIVCVVVFVMVLLIIVLAVSIIAFQHSTEITKLLNITSEREHLEMSKQILKSKIFHVITSSTEPTSFNQLKPSLQNVDNSVNHLLNITSEREHLEISKQILNSKIFHVITPSTEPTSLNQSKPSSQNVDNSANQPVQSFQTDESDVTATETQSTARTSQDLHIAEVTTASIEQPPEGFHHTEETTQTSPDVVDNFADLAHDRWKYKQLNSTHIRVHNPHLNVTHIREHNYTLPDQ